MAALKCDSEQKGDVEVARTYAMATLCLANSKQQQNQQHLQQQQRQQQQKQ